MSATVATITSDVVLLYQGLFIGEATVATVKFQNVTFTVSATVATIASDGVLLYQGLLIGEATVATVKWHFPVKSAPPNDPVTPLVGGAKNQKWSKMVKKCRDGSYLVHKVNQMCSNIDSGRSRWIY